LHLSAPAPGECIGMAAEDYEGVRTGLPPRRKR
jgi:hypothetical protein